MTKKCDVTRMRVGSHWLVVERITVIPHDKGSEARHRSVGSAATSDDNHRIAADASQEIHPANGGLDFGV
jgi:hypothetical protein